VNPAPARLSIGLTRFHTGLVDHFSMVASNPPGAHISTAGPLPTTS
jgi:hypothetical protein